jgi:predicted small lipoprotein YifL
MLRALQILAAASLAIVLLAGCGNKGQLVLPDQQPKKHKNAKPVPAQGSPDAKPAEPPPAQGDTNGSGH